MFGRIPKLVVLFLLTAILALVLGFHTFSTGQSLWIVSHLGPLGIAAAVTWLAVETWKEFTWSGAKRLLKSKEALGASLAITCGCSVVFLHQSYGFKVLNDELVLSANAASLHFDREVVSVLRSHQYSGETIPLLSTVDKRPIFFVCLLALVHDLSGYRVENVFILNTLITVALFVVIYCLGRALTGHHGGILGVLLWTTVPLVAINATGGGFELLNLLMIGLLMLAATRVLNRPGNSSISIMVLLAVLLAQTRYESVVFVAAVGALVLWTWIQEKRFVLPWAVVASPILLLCYPLQHKVFSSPRYWELKDGRTKPFSLDYLYDNVGHAAHYFFGTSPEMPNSFYVSVLGVFAVGLLFLTACRRGPRARKTPPVVVLIGVGIFIIGNFGLMLFYHWANFDSYVVHRFTLPLQFLMVLAIVFVVAEFNTSSVLWRPAQCLTAAWIIVFTIPFNARDSATKMQVAVADIEWQRRFLETVKDRDVLYVSASVLLPYLERVPGVPPVALNRKLQGLRFLLDQKIYSEIYVAQRLLLDPVTGATTPEESNELDPAIILETVEERTFVPLRVSRLSRVVRVDAPPAPIEVAPGTKPADAYVDALMKSLP